MSQQNIQVSLSSQRLQQEGSISMLPFQTTDPATSNPPGHKTNSSHGNSFVKNIYWKQNNQSFNHASVGKTANPLESPYLHDQSKTLKHNHQSGLGMVG